MIDRYPDMMIDSCASGGGRNDIETLRRSVPLHFSDFWDGNPGGFDEKQAAMISLPQWIPYFKLGMDISMIPNIPEVKAMNAESELSYDRKMYYIRSAYAPWFNIDVGEAINSEQNDTDNSRYDEIWALAVKASEEWHKLAPYFYAEHYPLTPCDKHPDAWRGWQFHEKLNESGFVQLFRGTKSDEATRSFRLHGLRKECLYVLTDLDGRPELIISGATLMEDGITVTLPEPGTSLILLIHGQ